MEKLSTLIRNEKLIGEGLIIEEPIKIAEILEFLSKLWNDPDLVFRNLNVIETCKRVVNKYGNDTVVKLYEVGGRFCPSLIIDRYDKFYFGCIRDGSCCYKNVHILPQDFENLVAKTEQDRKDFFLDNFMILSGKVYIGKNPDGSCKFSEKRNDSFYCTVNDYKPDICRLFPVRKVHENFVELELCPGFISGKGTLVEDWLSANRFNEFLENVVNYNISYNRYLKHLQKFGSNSPSTTQLIQKLYNL